MKYPRLAWKSWSANATKSRKRRRTMIGCPVGWRPRQNIASAVSRHEHDAAAAAGGGSSWHCPQCWREGLAAGRTCGGAAEGGDGAGGGHLVRHEGAVHEAASARVHALQRLRHLASQAIALGEKPRTTTTTTTASKPPHRERRSS
eukprot:scaffold2810_cov202-Prasinococcus_capsulatus_cf.AAC.1